MPGVSFASIRSRKVGLILAGALLCVLVAAGAIRSIRLQANRPTPELSTPVLAIETITARSLYYNAAARPWIAKDKPALLQKDDTGAGSPRARAFAQATQNPKLFRQLDRELRFDALLLSGDPTQYRPLLEHLIETNDWTLKYLDHTSLIYERGGKQRWEPADLAAIRRRFVRPREEATFLALAATKMIALHMLSPAEQLLAEAEQRDARIPEIWQARAISRMNQGDFVQAFAHIERALQLDPRSLPALGTKTQILYSTKKIPEALALSAKLIEARPEDPALLFYHAKIAHDAHAHSEEISALEKLVAVAEREGQPASGYRIYLAQAYAADGQAEPSIAQFTRVLADSNLSGEQRRFAEETLAQIKKRSGL
jgi:tetratricopeptide (TPR) repeat protein